MLKNLLSDFLGDLRAQKTRAFLTMFAVCWGTLSVVLLLAFGEGLKRALVAGTLGAGERMLVIYGGTTSQTYEGLPTGRSIRLTESDLELLQRNIPEIDMVSASYGRWGTTVAAGANKTTAMMEGVDPDFQYLRNMYPTAGGRFLNGRDMESRRRVVFLGDSIAKRLYPGEAAVGKTLLIDGVPFTVVGTMEKKMQNSMNNGPDADRVIIPASTMRTLYGRTYVSSLLVRPRDVTRVEAVKQRIADVLGSRYKFDAADQRALSYWDFIEEERMTRLISGGIQIFLGVVGALTLLVAGIGVANVMYVVVRERTREIGIKRSLGARRWHIVAQFVFEALLITLVGGGIGLALASGIVLGVDSLPDGNEAMQFLANPKLSWPIGLGTVGILVAIGLIAGVFPARKVARLDPVESLRYE
ncbi:MAG: ABC transporter permease [Gemmatimonadetes bacterium]|nr:ABC transporter permease [Gemmatimonadota bacterium]